MIQIRYVGQGDREAWFRLDGHLPEREFEPLVRDQRGYVLLEDGEPLAVLRYSLFWSEHPFCDLLFVAEGARGKGYGRALLARWEADMAQRGYRLLLTSTRSDETAQNFYRDLGYRDAGGLLLPGEPTELFLVKEGPFHTPCHKGASPSHGD